MSIVYFNKAGLKKKSSDEASYELWPMPWQALRRGNKFVSRKILLPEVYFMKSGMKCSAHKDYQKEKIFG